MKGGRHLRKNDFTFFLWGFLFNDLQQNKLYSSRSPTSNASAVNCVTSGLLVSIVFSLKRNLKTILVCHLLDSFQLSCDP